jgi:hypothetical protein
MKSPSDKLNKDQKRKSIVLDRFADAPLRVAHARDGIRLDFKNKSLPNRTPCFMSSSQTEATAGDEIIEVISDFTVQSPILKLTHPTSLGLRKSDTSSIAPLSHCHPS